MALRKPLVITAGRVRQLQAGDILDPAALPPLGLNLLANGGFDYFQRQTPATATTVATDKYGPDRWRMCSQAASLQSSRGAGPGSVNCAVIGQITNAGKCLVCQPVEYAVTVPLLGHVVTFQVQLKATAAKTIRLGLVQLTSAGTADVIPVNLVPTTWGAAGADPTLGTNLSYVAPSSVPSGAQGAVSGNAVSCSVTTSFQQFGGVFTVPAGAKNLLAAVWADAAFAAASGISLAEAGLYDGEALRTWSPLSPAYELMRCQRYCSKSYDIDIIPGGVTTGHYATGIAANTSNAYGVTAFKVTTRAVPAVTIYDAGGGLPGKVFDSTAGGAAITAVALNVAQGGFTGFTSATLFVANHLYSAFYLAESEL